MSSAPRPRCLDPLALVAMIERLSAENAILRAGNEVLRRENGRLTREIRVIRRSCREP